MRKSQELISDIEVRASIRLPKGIFLCSISEKEFDFGMELALAMSAHVLKASAAEDQILVLELRHPATVLDWFKEKYLGFFVRRGFIVVRYKLWRKEHVIRREYWFPFAEDPKGVLGYGIQKRFVESQKLTKTED